MVGLSFECDIDLGLLGALRHHENDHPVGNALFIVVDPSANQLKATMIKLAYCFPRAGGIAVEKRFSDWVRSGMPELEGKTFS